MDVEIVGLINLQMKYDLFSIPLPNVFIDEYMPYCNPIFAVVYITGLRHCYHANTNADIGTKDLSEILGISEQFVIEAWKHWENEGLVKILDETSGNLSIEFLAVEPRKNSNRRKKRSAEPELTVSEKKSGGGSESDSKNGSDKKITAPRETRPSYTVEELTLYTSRSEETRRLFSIAEKLLGKLLTYTEMNVIFGFYDWLRLPFDVIEMLLDYCVSNNKKNMRYIEKVALDWSDNNITTVEEAEAYINLFNNGYREVLKSFGQGRRDPTTKEISYMNNWLKQLKMPLDIVKEACEKTIAQTGSVQFAYADKIILDWHGKGIRTIDDIKTAENEYRLNKDKDKDKETADSDKSKSNNSKRTTSKKSGKNKFDNFESRDIDFNAIEKMERELLIKRMNEKI